MSETAPLFFEDWYYVLRAVAMSAVGYAALVAMLRIARKRTLSKMNVFDFVFVVALGSTLASTIVSRDKSLSVGLAALATLISLQVFLSWIIRTSKPVERIINGEPRLVFHRGEFLTDAMSEKRITREEILSAVRGQGLLGIEGIDAVVLETDGTFHVVWKQETGVDSSMQDVAGYGEPA